MLLCFFFFGGSIHVRNNNHKLNKYLFGWLLSNRLYSIFQKQMCNKVKHVVHASRCVNLKYYSIVLFWFVCNRFESFVKPQLRLSRQCRRRWWFHGMYGVFTGFSGGWIGFEPNNLWWFDVIEMLTFRKHVALDWPWSFYVIVVWNRCFLDHPTSPI